MTDSVFDPSAKPTKKVTPDTGNGEQKYPDYAFDPGNTPKKFAKHIIDTQNPQSGLIKAWSPSALKTFENCRYRIYLAKVLKFEEPKHPAMERGVEYHTACEQYVDGTISEFPKEMIRSPKLRFFQDDFNDLRDLYAEARVELEGEWAFDTDWVPLDWRHPNAWGRMKLDALRWEDEVSATVIDYKTGRKFGNEMAHADQGMQYVVGAFMRIPHLEHLTVSFWYLDQGEKSFPQRYSRSQAAMFLPRITERAVLLTSAQSDDFYPNPSIYNCKKCPFNRAIDGCQWRAQT
jgi:hypothetical protein